MGTSQNGLEKNLALITKYSVHKGGLPMFRAAVATYVNAALNAGGNIMAEAYVERDRSDTVWMSERWTEQDKYDAFQRNEVVGKLHDLFPETLHREVEVFSVEDLEPLTGNQWRRQPSTNDEPFVIMLILKAIAGSEDDFIRRYHTAMPAFRGEDGVVTYQLSRFRKEPATFITYEKFRSPEAFAYHLKFPPIEPIIDFLHRSIENPPFEQGLHFLIEFAPHNFSDKSLPI